MYVKNYGKAEGINFLASATVTSFTEQISNSGVAADANGRKVVKAGTVWPANDATAKGLVYSDVDVTEGPQPGAVLYEAWVIEERLPELVDALAKPELPGIKFR
ncbi:hypothetical protein [Sporosarcina sp. P17b]|uniref:hypothetical protein n=1 Tax=Sporosarcina sp. P17b TaxID=2048260 RepID=UPI000C17398C|nr:hypothetical protein [Sporosarcina sp. P17b]PIC72424.1 hypothetical protein CSV76_15380 [Sporosarcina sp. P17b]